VCVCVCDTNTNVYLYVWIVACMCLCYRVHFHRPGFCVCCVRSHLEYYNRSQFVNITKRFLFVLHKLIHDSSMCVTRLVHMCDMTHPRVRHNSFIVLARTNLCVTHDSSRHRGKQSQDIPVLHEVVNIAEVFVCCTKFVNITKKIMSYRPFLVVKKT